MTGAQLGLISFLILCVVVGLTGMGVRQWNRLVDMYSTNVEKNPQEDGELDFEDSILSSLQSNFSNNTESADDEANEASDMDKIDQLFLNLSRTCVSNQRLQRKMDLDQASLQKFFKKA